MVTTTTPVQVKLPPPEQALTDPLSRPDQDWWRWFRMIDTTARSIINDIGSINITKATAAQLRALTSDFFVGTAGVTGAMAYVSGGNVNGNYTPDYTAFRNLTITLTGNSTLKFPSVSLTNVIGLSGMIEVVQDGTGGRTLGFDVPGTNGYVFSEGAAPSIDTTLSHTNGLMYHIRSASRIWIGLPFRGVR